MPFLPNGHNAGIIEQIRSYYGDKVQFVWRAFPAITVQSPKAAEAAQCAYDQGKFWEYHDLLFARAPALGLNDLKVYAAELGWDTNQLNHCLDSGEDQETVRRKWQDAKAHDFLGRRSFLINYPPLVGPPTTEFLGPQIDAILRNDG